MTPQQLSFFYGHAPPADAAAREVMQQQLLTRHTQIDMDPLDNMQRKAWWLLYAGERAQVRFSGTRLGILTMIRPDAGVVTCDVDGGRHETRVTLLDRWSYFWRLWGALGVLWRPQGAPGSSLGASGPISGIFQKIAEGLLAPFLAICICLLLLFRGMFFDRFLKRFCIDLYVILEVFFRYYFVFSQLLLLSS